MANHSPELLSALCLRGSYWLVGVFILVRLASHTIQTLQRNLSACLITLIIWYQALDPKGTHVFAEVGSERPLAFGDELTVEVLKSYQTCSSTWHYWCAKSLRVLVIAAWDNVVGLDAFPIMWWCKKYKSRAFFTNLILLPSWKKIQSRANNSGIAALERKKACVSRFKYLYLDNLLPK